MIYIIIIVLIIVLFPTYTHSEKNNINGIYMVKYNDHYSNKSSVTWGMNSDKIFSVNVKLSLACSTYDCKNTTSYTCEDSMYQYDWNKLWGKARCGYYNSHHDDSDRFVFRKCSDNSCNAYNGENRIQIGAYSYDNGIAPYTGERPDLMKTFTNTILPDQIYKLTLTMNDDGLSTFDLSDINNNLIETQYINHENKCIKNYYEGIVDGLYFGGTCRAPIDIIVTYYS